MSSLVFPFHDPNNIETKFLKQLLPTLKEEFDSAFVSITPETLARNPEAVDFLIENSFFVVNENPEGSLVGDHFVSCYKNSIENSKSDQLLHLCTSDRTIFALFNYKDNYLSDINSVNSPYLFMRSEKAWSTHPANYYAAESMLTEAGKILFGKTLDFAWCHLTLTVDRLNKVLPNLTARNFCVFFQLVFSLRDEINTGDVDWLSWEDPFILDKDPQKYKLERETDPAELEKRMSYVLPGIKYLFEEYRKLQSTSLR
ncbi:MAG: hypothetical protein ACD_22C00221G0008 [uncultured bacterium]|nr:MAG: hypothetical protein ACD_22C00221G0008 [uncultured bacterium]